MMPLAIQTQLFRIASGLILFGIASAVSQSSQAQEADWYIDLGYQATDLNGDAASGIAVYDATLGRVNAHLGYNVSSYFSVEGEVGIGVKGDQDIASYDPSLNFFAPPPIVDLKENYSVGIFGRLHHDFSSNIIGFAKVGVSQSRFALTSTAFSDIVAEGPFTSETNIDEIGVAFGIGSQIYLKDDFGLRIDLTQYNLGEFENSSISLGLSHRF